MAKNFGKKKTAAEKKRERKSSLEEAFNYCNEDGKASLETLAEYLGKSEKSVKRYINESDFLTFKNGEIFKIMVDKLD